MIGTRRGRGADDERLRHLFQSNAADLLNYFARRVTPIEDAADLLSETLVAACRHARALPDDPERARMWLFVTAKNTLRNHRRGSRRRLALSEKLGTAIAITATAEDHSDLRDAIGNLEPRARELIRLVYWDGFTISEAAELVRIPASTARSRLQAARHQLRTALEPELLAPALDTAREPQAQLTKEFP